ncbi:hypothetical protein K2X92_05695, partial [Candidatus Gracilibacteria bacterium]|nr:hypothetical protein [Candidatus Gracilibacteria bacterium]
PTGNALDAFSMGQNNDKTKDLRNSLMKENFNGNYLKIDDKYLDNDALYDYYKESFVDNNSTYSFIFNNCSDEVRRALNRAGFMTEDSLVINTPDHVYNLVRNQLNHLNSISQ